MSENTEREVQAVRTLGLLNSVEVLEPMLELAEQLEEQAKLLRQSFRDAREEYRESHRQGCRLFSDEEFERELRIYDVTWKERAKKIHNSL